MALPMSYAGQRMTLDEFFALEGDEFRHAELQEGVLVMSPSPGTKHQRVLRRLTQQFVEQLPVCLEPTQDVDVVLQAGRPATVRQPDIAVTRVIDDRPRIPVSDVVLAVEIISPGSRKVDLKTKVYEYAEAGIPHYWAVDLNPPVPTTTVFHLGAPDDGYVEEPAVDGRLTTSLPFPLTIDLDALVR
jgi:Uma2 family endonuclease